MVTYDDEEVKLNMPLFIHAVPTNQNALTYTHKSFIESYYNYENDISTLKTRTPTIETVYTYINNTIKILFVNVITDKENDIFILTFIPIYNILRKDNCQFYPNPILEQLLSVSVEKLR